MGPKDGTGLVTEMTSKFQAEVADLLHLEAYHLDRHQWADWLMLYANEAVFWAPAHVSDSEYTTDPETEVSLIYMDRAGLEARIFRIESGDSYASDPLPRTVHLISNILITEAQSDRISVAASWIVHEHSRAYGSITRGGLYEYYLVRGAKDLRISRKKITLIDDTIVGPLDIYNL